MTLRRVSVQERRRAMLRRHHLRGDADGPEAATRAMLALHATDPASVYISVLARSATSTLADVGAAMYERRTLVRWMAMRRTLFLLPYDDVALIQAAVSTPLAVTLRSRLVSQLRRNGTDPPIHGDIDAWLADAETRVEDALRGRESATGAQLGADVSALQTAITPKAPSDRPQKVTSALLTLMSAQGRIVRSTPTGDWTSRQHRWAPVETWWPDGLPQLDPAASRTELARRWLARFGPATVEDLQWWTGWNRTTARGALAGVATEDVDLHGRSGIALQPHDDDDQDRQPTEPVATLLPALDPTPMGWKHRDWLFGIDPRLVFDHSGNIGPTVWWDGEIIGSWATSTAGEIHTLLAADRGTPADRAVAQAASQLQDRLHRATITPAVRTPLETRIGRSDRDG